MKNFIKISLLTLLSVLTVFSACNLGGGGESSGSDKPDSSFTEVDTVEVSCILNDIEVEDIYLESYDFTKCFEITVNGELQEVKEEYLDLSALKPQAGTYTIYCSFEGRDDARAQAEVRVISNEYLLELSKEEITVNKSYALTFDYLALFTAYKNGEQIAIEEDMIQTDITDAIGSYYFTVNFYNQTKTLRVIVNNEHEVTVHVSYPSCEIALSNLSTFDLTSLFSLFVDGVAQKVTLDMIDASSLQGAKVGDECEIYFYFQKDDTIVNKSAKITVAKDEEIIINAKNVQTYPNSGAIELTSLFSITKGDEIIEVTTDMIEGSIDYSVAGINEIVLTYNGMRATATVEVVIGVVINYREADVVVIKKGTLQSTYAFEKDFIVNVNGIRFSSIAEYIDTSSVDFSTVGSYIATLTIPYNENKFGLSGVKFDYYEKNITYLVVENDYKLSLKEELVTLPKGTESYNPFKNVSLSINGINQTLTSVPEYADRISCYAKVVSEPIDFSSTLAQEVVVEVYVNGVSAAPVIVSFEVVIESDVVISATDKVIFSGETLMATDLFQISKGGNAIEVEFEMITGKIDSFTPGVYYVTVNFEGVSKTAKTVVLNNEMKGTYRTNMYAISETNNDYDEEYGDSAPSKKRVGPMSITEDGKIVLKGLEAELVDAVDQNTLVIKYRTDLHTLYYDNGIIVIIPENAIKLSYHEEKRPYIYFDTEVWSITKKVILNSSDSYVLDSSNVCYSFDIFTLKNNLTGKTKVYALKTHLASRSNSDTIYLHSWGEGTFADGFVASAGTTSNFVYDGEIYNFTMEDGETGRIPLKDDGEKPFKGMVFKGTVDGKSATLAADSYQAFTFTVDGNKIFYANSYDVNMMDNGGVNSLTNEIFLYCGDKSEGIYYSYKFIVDPTQKTFVLVEKDNLFGYYETDNGYIFLDGYGSGFINFDSQSYYETDFTYSKLNNIITLKYKNLSPEFNYGSESKFILDAFGNMLTVHSGLGLSIGAVYENIVIQSGIIVKVNVETIGAAADSVAKAELYRAIEITDKNGVVPIESRKDYIVTNTISFGTPGFYSFAITADVFGKDVTAYYAIQVLKSLYSGNPIVNSYGAGVIYPENGLTIDEYGRVMLLVGNDLYKGSLKLDDEGKFTSELFGEKGVVNIDGKLIAKGLVQIRASGAVGYLDYYTVGKNYLIGKDTTVLRAFDLSGQKIYLLATSETSATAEVVNVECINGQDVLSIGAILKITHLKGISYVKTVSWGDVKNGLLLSDKYIGSYSGEDGTLVLDGFGNATLGGEIATYVINGENKITVFIGNNPRAYQLDLVDHAYSVMDIAFDNTLVEGRIYSASYYFFCESYMYSATTTFAFLENGKVRITSTSAEHDSGDEMCMTDKYTPVFCPNGSVVGTYSVTGTKITVSANGYTFIFNLSNVVYKGEIVCLSTNVETDAHGYFAENSLFSNNSN